MKWHVNLRAQQGCAETISANVLNCYCRTSITMEFISLSRVLSSLNVKGQPTYDHFPVVLIAQLGEHYNSNAKVVGSNPVQSLKMFPGHFSSSIMVAFASIIMSKKITILLTEHRGCRGEYWSKAMAGQTKCREVCTK